MFAPCVLDGNDGGFFGVSFALFDDGVGLFFVLVAPNKVGVSLFVFVGLDDVYGFASIVVDFESAHVVVFIENGGFCAVVSVEDDFHGVFAEDE